MTNLFVSFIFANFFKRMKSLSKLTKLSINDNYSIKHDQIKYQIVDIIDHADKLLKF